MLRSPQIIVLTNHCACIVGSRSTMLISADFQYAQAYQASYRRSEGHTTQFLSKSASDCLCKQWQLRCEAARGFSRQNKNQPEIDHDCSESGPGPPGLPPPLPHDLERCGDGATAREHQRPRARLQGAAAPAQRCGGFP